MTCRPLQSIPRPIRPTEHFGRQTEHIRGKTEHIGAQTEHIRRRSGHIGGQTGHIHRHPLYMEPGDAGGRCQANIRWLLPSPSMATAWGLRTACPSFTECVQSGDCHYLLLSLCPAPPRAALAPPPAVHPAHLRPRPSWSHHARACVSRGPAPARTTRPSTQKIRAKLSLASPIPYGDRAGERQFPLHPHSLDPQHLVPNSQRQTHKRHGV